MRNFLDFEPIPGIEWEYDFVKMILPQIVLADINSYAAMFIKPKDITVMLTGPEKEDVKFPSEQRTLEIIDSVKVMELKPYTENVLSDNLLKKTPKAGSVKSTKSVADFEGVTFDAIVSNPPYIPNSDRLLMRPNVTEHEPDMALFVEDSDPLIFYRAIARTGHKMLSTDGRLYFEIYESLVDDMVAMLEVEGYTDIVVKEDFRGKPRMICARVSSTTR